MTGTGARKGPLPSGEIFMSQKSRQKGPAVASLLVDAASYVYATWLSGGQLSPRVGYWDIQIDLSSGATIGVDFASDSAGTGVFATTTLYASANFPSGQLIGVTMMTQGSVFYNFKPSATVTFRTMIVNERFDW